MAEEGDRKSSIRVVDKRRFDTGGEERQNADLEEASGSAGDTSSAGDRTAAGKRAAGFEQRPGRDADVRQNVQQSFNEEESMAEEAQGMGQEITFSSFVISLATQALMQLGQMTPPSGVQIPVDKTAAKQTIDILEMLAEKTRGNLDDEEVRLLEEILHNLRISFVRAPG